MKRRRSLTHIGGEIQRHGQKEAAAALAEAIDVAPSQEPRGGATEDDPDRSHVHGFHSYPARMHPATAARLVRAVCGEGQTLLDPFCGSGTVLVEAMIAGRRAVGTDLNPLAVRLAKLKTARTDAATREAILVSARDAAALANERRQRRAGASKRYVSDDVAAFDPHILLELDSLRVGVQSAKDEGVRAALEMVLSAILVKVSRKASDTAGHQVPRRIAAGYPTKLLVKKAAELVRRLADFEALLPPGVPPARVELDDATRLRSVKPGSVDGVVTSPPYVATYDYLAHHALRMRWLGLDTKAFGENETGSRRRYATLDARQAIDAWTRELTAILRCLSRVCRRGARLALLIADSAVQGQALRADEMLATIAPAAGLQIVARASQLRPHFHGPTARAFEHVPRAEHAIALEKS